MWLLTASPQLKREQLLGHLADTDPARRAEALRYVSVQARHDRKVLAAAIRALHTPDDTVFNEIALALDAAGLWSHPPVPCEQWVRWVGLVSIQDQPAARILAAQRLGQAADCAGVRQSLEILERFIGDEAHPDVRYNGLIAAAQLATAADDPVDYDALVARMTGDRESVLAQQAWIFMGLLGVPITPELNPADSPHVRQARQWAIAQSSENPNARTHDEPRPDPSGVETTAPAIEHLLRSPTAAVRDVGCVLAVQRLDDQQVKDMATRLLMEPALSARRGGVILSGLAGIQPRGVPKGRQTEVDLLQAAMDEAPDDLGPYVRVAEWMQGRRPELDGLAASLLGRPDLPASTVALALMHREHQNEAMDYLLNPMGEPPLSLDELLVGSRWWLVLRRYLPSQAPSVDLDADPDLQMFQIDVLRDWYLLDRTRLRAMVAKRGRAESSAVPQ